MVRGCFPNVSHFPIRETLFPSPVLFSTPKLCLRYTAGNFNEHPSMRALAKILRARASEHLSNFCGQFEQRPNFANTFKLDGTIRYLSNSEIHSLNVIEIQTIFFFLQCLVLVSDLKVILISVVFFFAINLN